MKVEGRRAKMLNFLKNDEKGISIAEFLVAVTIFLLVSGAIYTLFISGYDTYNYGDRQIEAQQNVRAAMIQMAKEIRNSYQILNEVDYPTNASNLSLWGVQIMDETLTVNAGTAQAEKYPWLRDEAQPDKAQPVVYKKQPDGSFLPITQYEVNWGEGRLSNFSPALTETDVIKADYTYDVKIIYKVEAGELKRVEAGSPKTITRYIVNDLSNPEEAAFIRQDNLIKIKLIVDRDPSKPPARYILETWVKARK